MYLTEIMQRENFLLDWGFTERSLEPMSLAHVKICIICRDMRNVIKEVRAKYNTNSMLSVIHSPQLPLYHIIIMVSYY